MGLSLCSFIDYSLCIDEVDDSLGVVVVGNAIDLGEACTFGFDVWDAVGNLPELLSIGFDMSLGSFVSGLLGLEVVGNGAGAPEGNSVMGLSMEDWTDAELRTLDGEYVG